LSLDKRNSANMDFELNPAIIFGSRAFQLTAILEENRHTPHIVKLDPLLYEDARKMLSMWPGDKDAPKSSIVLLYSCVRSVFLEEMNYADRVFYFAEGLAQRDPLARIVERLRLALRARSL
jgi:hypothetical protein